MPVSCEETRRSIPFLLDDELDPEYTLELEDHLSECSECRSELEREGRLRLTLRRAADSITAPVALRRRIRESIEREDRQSRGFTKLWPAAAAGLILMSFVYKGATGNGGFSTDLDHQMVERVDWPPEVTAAEVAPVQSYLRTRLPFNVELPNPPSPNKVSLGARIVRLNNRDAAYVRYELPRGRMAVFVYEEPGVSEVQPGYFGRQVQLGRIRGYTTARWRSRGLVYSIVTDLPEPEIERYVRPGPIRAPSQPPQPVVKPAAMQ